MKRHKIRNEDRVTRRARCRRDHDPRTGKFAPGNRAAVGNKNAIKAATMRMNALRTFTQEELNSMLVAVFREAKQGDIGAFTAIWDRLIGKPIPMDHRELEDIEREAREKERNYQAHDLVISTDDQAPKRRRLLTKKLIHEFTLLLGGGLPADGCCDMLGIDYETFKKWLKQGQDNEHKRSGRTKEDKLAVKFLRAVRRAQARWRFLMTRQADSNYRALRLLERRDSRSFGEDQDEDTAHDLYDEDERFL